MRRLRWVLTAALLAWSCGPVAPRPQRFTVGVNGGYDEGEDDYANCEGVHFTERHEVRSGGVDVRYEGEDGLLARGTAWLARGEMVQSSGFDPLGDAGPYTMFGLGGAVGQDRRNAGIEGGLQLAFSAHDAAPLPFLRFKLGRTDVVWAELTLGPDDPQYYVNFAALGLGIRAGGLRLRFGLSAYGHLIVSRQPDHGRNDDLDPGDDGYVSRRDEKGREPLGLFPASNADSGAAYVDLQLDLARGLGLSAGGLLTRDEPTAHLGLYYHF
jgi:hypothetical protein